MMRCIENAIAGGYITREQGQTLQDEVDALLRRGLAPEDVRDRVAADLDQAAKNRRKRALLQEARRKVLTEQLMTHRNARGENDPAEALWLLMENPVGFGGKFPSLDYRRLAIIGVTHAELNDLLHEFRKGFFSGDLRRMPAKFAGFNVGGNKEVRVRMDNLVREIYGVDTGDARAKELAQAWLTVTERLRQRYNRGGGAIGKLDRGWFPQSHEPEALMNIGQQGWVDYLMRDGVLDRERMKDYRTGRPLDDDELRHALMEAWKTITTDGWIDREASYQAYGRGSLSKQKDEHHRFIQFKDADQHLAYMRDFDAGDPFRAMMGHVSSMARDIATLEILGPNPESMRNYLKQLVMQHAAQIKPIQGVIRDEFDRLGRIFEHVLPGDVGQRYVARTKAALEDLAGLELKLKAGGGDEKALKEAARSAVSRLESLETELQFLEPAHIGERRAKLNAERDGLRGEIETITGKNAPQLDGLSRRNKRKLADLREREADLSQKIEDLDAADNSILREEPEIYQDVIDTVERVKGEVRVLRTDGFRAVKDPIKAANIAIHRMDEMYDVFRGTNYAPVSSKVADVAQTSRNVVTAASMGMASLTSIPGDVVSQVMARRMTAMPSSVLAIMRDTLGALTSGSHHDAIESGLIVDSAMHVLNREAARIQGVNTVTLSSYLADRVLHFNGMTPFTEASKHSFGLLFFLRNAKWVDRSFEALPMPVRRAFAENGIRAREWDLIRQTQMPELRDGVKVLRPKEIAAGPAGEELATRYLEMTLRYTRLAVVENTLRARSIVGGERPGTFMGELVRFMTQFKSFAIAHTIGHLVPIVRTWQGGARMEAAQRATLLLATSAIMGAISVELHNVFSGRRPQLLSMMEKGQTPGAAYWLEGILKAGGLGVLGDYLLAPVNANGGGLASTLIGPVLGKAEKLRGSSLTEFDDWYEGKNKEGRFARNAINVVDGIVPGSNMWMFKLLKERIIINWLQRHFDPNAEKVFKRQEQLTARVKGTDFWWRPGEYAPSRPIFTSDSGAPARTIAKPADGKAELPIGTKFKATSSTPFNIVDGDTVEIAGRRWRIEGYDAPEVYSSAKTGGERVAGVKAALRLQQLIADAKTVEMTVSNSPDHWGRGRGHLMIDGQDVGDIMKREGHVKRETAHDRWRQPATEKGHGAERR